MSSEISITQNQEMDVAALFNNAKGNTSEENHVVKTPLQMMQEKKNSGIQIVNNNDDGPKIGGSMTDQRMEDVHKTMDNMDELAEKAKLVGITHKPTTDIELAELVDRLDNLDINELKQANAIGGANSENVIKSDDLVGADISAETIVSDTPGVIDKTGLFVPKSVVTQQGVGVISANNTEENKEDVEAPAASDTVSVVITKEAVEEGGTMSVEFTDEEREKLTESKQIELISVHKININTGKVSRPDANFLSQYTSHMHKAISSSAVMTFVASRFRATLRGLTFGEYVDLALSTDITEVETLNKKLTTIYNAIINTSIGAFTSYDDFLRNFAFKDVNLGTYALYISTNSETLELGLECGVDSCKKKFTTTFSPRNLLVTNQLGERFLELMEETGSLDGQPAIDFHNQSSIIEKQVIELRGAGICIEVGLRSCYDMIHIVIPFTNKVESVFQEKYPDDVNKIHEIITYASNYISAIYFKDDNGEYTVRDDSIETIVDVIYNLPITDYEIVSAIMNQSDEDYAYNFGVQHVTCPSCGNVTEVVTINLDEEVFRQFQELGSTRIDKTTLPRL